MRRRGSQAVELALVLPVLLALISGIVDLTQYLWLAEALTGAVSAGARAGAVTDPRRADPLAIASAEADAAFRGSEVGGDATFRCAWAGSSPQRRLVVTGTLAFTPWFGFVPLPPDVGAAATVRAAVQPD